MKGIILAGGSGTRLYPLTKATNKHLLPVGELPMILHPVQKLTEAGIEEILIVTGPEHLGSFAMLLGSGKDYGARFTYKVQDEAGGIAQALQLARNFAGSEPMAVILGDNIFEGSLAPAVKAFSAEPEGAMIFLKEVSDPTRFGIAEIQDGRVVSIEEKPQQPRSNYCVTGIYLYDTTVFDIISTVRPSDRGEMEISDVNATYMERGALKYAFLDGWWTDAGTFPSLAEADRLARGGQ